MKERDKYEMLLKIRDVANGGVNIELTCNKLSSETLTAECQISLEEADKLGLKSVPGAPTVMYQIMDFLTDKMAQLKKS